MAAKALYHARREREWLPYVFGFSVMCGVMPVVMGSCWALAIERCGFDVNSRDSGEGRVTSGDGVVGTES